MQFSISKATSSLLDFDVFNPTGREVATGISVHSHSYGVLTLIGQPEEPGCVTLEWC
jgi:hypothetical protein